VVPRSVALSQGILHLSAGRAALLCPSLGPGNSIRLLIQIKLREGRVQRAGGASRFEIMDQLALPFIQFFVFASLIYILTAAAAIHPAFHPVLHAYVRQLFALCVIALSPPNLVLSPAIKAQPVTASDTIVPCVRARSAITSDEVDVRPGKPIHNGTTETRAKQLQTTHVADRRHQT
jgi:hypothetical protein